MEEEYVQKLDEALQLIRKAETIIRKVQIEMSSELVRLENKEKKNPNRG